MSSSPYQVPVEELERSTRVPRTDQVVSVGDGMGPPPVQALESGDHDADGDSD